MEQEFYTVREAALLLRVHEETVRRWLRDGSLPQVKVGRNWRIHRTDLMRKIDEHKGQEAG